MSWRNTSSKASGLVASLLNVVDSWLPSQNDLLESALIDGKNRQVERQERLIGILSQEQELSSSWDALNTSYEAELAKLKMSVATKLTE